MGGGGHVLSGKLGKLPRTVSPPAAEEATAKVGRGAEMATPGTSTVAAAFSSSSLSLGASVDTCSAVLQLSAPQLVAKSPSLLKANRGMAEAAAIRGPLPPCVFTLRGRRPPTREQATAKPDSNGGCRPATAGGSPRRPPYRVEIGRGYSPRLRLMGREDSADGSKLDGSTATVAGTAESAVVSLSQVLVQPGSPASRRGAGTINTNDATWAAAPASASRPACSSRRTLQPSREQTTTWERDLQLDPSTEAVGTPANTGRGSQAKTKLLGSSYIQERLVTSSRANGLCGRLWMGTTAPKPEAARPRILFLVSGQQQQLEDPALRTKYRVTSRQQPFHTDPVVVPLPLPTKAGEHDSSRVALPPSSSKRAVSRGRQRGSAAGSDDARADREITEGRKEATEDEKPPESGRPGEGLSSPGSRRARDHAVSPPKTRTGPDSDGMRDESATTAATDGKGGDCARRVLCVRVPHPPPTSLLILRSAPPTA